MKTTVVPTGYVQLTDAEFQAMQDFEKGLQAENARLRKLYYLAANDVIFFGPYDPKTDSWPDCGEFYTPAVCLNDTFAYASADAEPVADEQIDRLIAAWKEFGYAGVIAWAALLRGSEPIKPWRTAEYERAKAKLTS